MAFTGFSCCERNDESTYVHGCACPSIQLVMQMEEQDAELCGFSEYEDSPTVVPSVPPKKYLVETHIITNTFGTSREAKWCWDDGEDSDDGDWVIWVTRTAYENVFNIVGTYNPEDCTFSQENTSTLGTFTSEDQPTCDNSTFGFSSSELVSNTQSDTIDSTTSRTIINNYDRNKLKWRRAFGERINEISFDSGDTGRTDTYALSSEDTEEAALERASITNRNFPDNGVTSYNSSRWELRSQGFDFLYRTAKYGILLTDLIVGFSYDVVVPVTIRDAGNVSNGEWEQANGITVSFTATDVFQVFGASLNSKLTVQEFRDADFSLTRTDYPALDVGETVLVAETEVPITQGVEYFLGYNPNIGDQSNTPYIEKSA